MDRLKLKAVLGGSADVVSGKEVIEAGQAETQPQAARKAAAAAEPPVSATILLRLNRWSRVFAQ